MCIQSKRQKKHDLRSLNIRYRLEIMSDIHAVHGSHNNEVCRAECRVKTTRHKSTKKKACSRSPFWSEHYFTKFNIFSFFFVINRFICFFPWSNWELVAFTHTHINKKNNSKACSVPVHAVFRRMLEPVKQIRNPFWVSHKFAFNR